MCVHVNLIIILDVSCSIPTLWYTPHDSDIELYTEVQPWHTLHYAQHPLLQPHLSTFVYMPQLPLGGLSSICPSPYRCNPNPSHSALVALVWTSRSSTNSSVSDDTVAAICSSQLPINMTRIHLHNKQETGPPQHTQLTKRLRTLYETSVRGYRRSGTKPIETHVNCRLTGFLLTGILYHVVF